MTTPTEISGMDLKLERVAARVTQIRLAAAMGVSNSRVTAIEREAVVSDAMAARYRDALRTCSTARTKVA